MAKLEKHGVNHAGMIFLLIVFAIFILINCIPLLMKDDDHNLVFNGEEEVFLMTKLPLTDGSAKELDVSDIQDGIIGSSDFSIELGDETMDVVDYEIYLTDEEPLNSLNYNYIKIYLTDGEGNAFKEYQKNILPTYSDLRVPLGSAEKRILFKGKIKYGEVKKFKLRIWVADTYVLDNDVKDFFGRISVDAIS